MKKEYPLRKVGFISKLNNFNGELVIAGVNDDILESKFLFMIMDGIPVPFCVVEMFDKGGNVIVKLEDVNDEATARRFIKCDVYLELRKHKSKRTTVPVDQLINFKVIDSEYGDLGPIVRIDSFPQQEIAVCIFKEKEVLIPLNDEFIDEIDDESSSVYMTLPSGLIDLYLG